MLAAALLVLTASSGCGAAHGAPPRDPDDVLAAYAAALEAGRVEEAYSLLSAEAQKSIPFDAYQRMVSENPDEVRDIAAVLGGPAGAPLVTATVTTPDGETLLLVLENGEWRVDGSAVDLYSQSTPEAAVHAFLRAYANKRYDILMRFVPERQSQGLDAAKLKKAWDGDQKEEMDRLTQALQAALPTAHFELLGDRATMAYGAGGTVEFVREAGDWKIEDFK